MLGFSDCRRTGLSILTSTAYEAFLFLFQAEEEDVVGEPEDEADHWRHSLGHPNHHHHHHSGQDQRKR